MPRPTAARCVTSSPAIRSTARRVIDESFAAIPFHLTYKCDGCLYNEFCMKRSAEMDDLSLLPHLTEQDKRALRRNGIATPGDLVALKDLRRGERFRSTASSRSGLSWWRPREIGPRSPPGRHLARRAAPRRADPPRPQLPTLEEGRHRGSTYIPSKATARCPTQTTRRTPTSSGSTSMPSMTTCSIAPICSAPSSSPARVERNAGTAEERRSAERGSTGHPGQRGAPLR